MRISANKLYVLADHPGISGFRDYSRNVEAITTGLKAVHNKSYVVREFKPQGHGSFELHDGHLPGYRPIVSEELAIQWLEANPYQYISQTSNTL